MRVILLTIGSLLPAVSTLVYVRSILQGQTRPHRTTYVLFVAITGLTFFSLLASHDQSGIWLAGISFLQTLVVCVLALRFGMGGKDVFDVICFILCVCGLGLWVVTGESLLGLCTAIAADFLAMLPAVRKMWRHPHTEIWSYYGLDSIGAVLIVLAGPYDWRALLYPTYLLFANALCAAVILRRKQSVAAPAQTA